MPIDAADRGAPRSRIFWNNFEAVLQDHNRRISGNPGEYWHNHVIRSYGMQDRAFVLSCGSGWVERDLFGKGFIGSVIGVDGDAGALAQARVEAAKIGMEAEYLEADINAFEPGEMRANVAISVGAMHRIPYLNRVTERMAGLVNGGLLIGYDYTGPHRNQYSWATWSRALELNRELPKRFRTVLRYPHLATMLASDPREAVHPELQMEVLNRHFDLLECQPLGGGLAYLLLLNNHALLDEQLEPEGKQTIATILAADAKLAQTEPEANLFTFYVGRPKRAAAPAYLRAAWQSEEDERELQAEANGSRYYKLGALAMIYDGVSGGPAAP